MAGPAAFKAYTGLGFVFAVVLCVPGAAFALLLFGYLLPPLGTPAAGLVGLGLFIAWAVVVGRAFVPVCLEPTGTGLTTRFFRLNRATFAPWSDVKLYHIAGGLFAVGSVRALPISWLAVRRHADFWREVSGHLTPAPSGR